MGAITPNGLDPETLWEAVRSGRSGIDVLSVEDLADLAGRSGGQVRGFDAESVLPRALARRLSPVQHWAIAAADQALVQAGIGTREPGTRDSGADALPWERDRVGVIAATGSGPVDAMQSATRSLLHRK